jgi:hypothetical protein
MMLRDRLRIVMETAGRQFHDQFHRYFGSPCQGFGLPAYAWSSNEIDRSAGDVLSHWTAAYLEEFENTHRWPARIRAARYLRANFSHSLASTVSHVWSPAAAAG